MSKLSVLILFFAFTANADVWTTLMSIHPASSKASPKIKELMVKPVQLNGFAIIDETNDQDIDEFLFTSVQVGCIHDPLPTPNKLIHVKLEKKVSPALLTRRLSLRGKIALSSRSDASYEMVAESLK